VFDAQILPPDEFAETPAATILLISVAEYRHEDLELMVRRGVPAGQVSAW
jgi:hypothetical protein